MLHDIAALGSSTAMPELPLPPSLPEPRRALLFFQSHQDTYRRPLFSSKEVFCGPDTDTRAAAGRVLALKTKVGDSDAADVLRQLPANRQPEYVVVKADATRRNFPRNLAAFSCPKILLVGDTHHLASPISSLIRYAREEPFDFVIFDHTRHHARFFAEAGAKNLHWLPALDYGFVPRPLRAAPTRELTFVGQAGKHHPYRCAVLEQLRAAGLPVEVLRGSLAETADFYADSKITLNISLNGDLNLRVFESLAAGGFLLTDALTPESGLSRLFDAGRHLDTWRTPGELAEKIKYYQSHPEIAARIRREGQLELHRAHHPAVKLREFYDLIDSGKINPRYDLAEDISIGRTVTVVAPELPSKLAAYEAIQELHRNSALVTILTDEPASLTELSTLPRLQFSSEILPPLKAAGALAQPQVLWWHGERSAQFLPKFLGMHVIEPTGATEAREVLASWGFTAVAENSPLLTLSRPLVFLRQAWIAGAKETARMRLAAAIGAVDTSVDCVELAEFADQLEDPEAKVAALQRAVALDRGNQTALLALAAVYLDRNENAGAGLMLEEAARVSALPSAVDQLRVELGDQLRARSEFSSYYRSIGRIPVEPTERPRKVLLVTNLFPPQELGGYGRMMWEFAQGLRARGHTVRVLTADERGLAKTPTTDETAMESCVSRELELLGTWKGGKPELVTDPAEVVRRKKANAKRIRTAAHHMGADVVLAGNLDFIGIEAVNAALAVDRPVLHALANLAPDWPVAQQPNSPHYWVAPCSEWNGGAFRRAGFTPDRVETLYPGARIDRFFRFFLPDTAKLRLCFASLVLPYKGAHVLIEALARLHHHGVDLTAEIAGDTPDAAYREQLLTAIRVGGLEGKVKLTGFLDREGLSALFARSNVLAFPSLFEEPFGISQVEAMAAGLVVVSSGTGGAKEIVRHNLDGLLYQAGDPGDLAVKLLSLANDQSLFARLQQAGQRRAMVFSSEAAVRRIEALSEELLAQ